MKIEVIEPKGEWDFPCKGVRKIDDAIVLFERDSEGVVLESNDKKELYYYSKFWDMDCFEPIAEQNYEKIDLNKTELPVWVKDKNREILFIDNYSINNEMRVMYYTYIHSNDKIIQDAMVFGDISEIDEWLNSLEILPKGTEIKITI